MTVYQRKYPETNKEIKRQYDKIIKVHYNDMCYLLYYKNPFAFNAGKYGWNSDFYHISSDYADLCCCISTGYRPIGNLQIDFVLLHQYNNMAQEIIQNENVEFKEEKVDFLLHEILKTVL